MPQAGKGPAAFRGWHPREASWHRKAPWFFLGPTPFARQIRERTYGPSGTYLAIQAWWDPAGDNGCSLSLESASVTAACKLALGFAALVGSVNRYPGSGPVPLGSLTPAPSPELGHRPKRKQRSGEVLSYAGCARAWCW
jgi:hypothetical protein